MKRKFFKKSNVICFFIINAVIVIALIAYGLISKEQAAQRVSQKLREDITQKGIMMEDYLQPEIALTKKLATSPTAIEFFENPSDDELRERAMTEFQSFRDAFASHIIFWANDKDREFYNAMEYSYTINPDNPADYWYKMTLYDTDVYNFNINYNADLDMTCLWLNAVVRDKKMKPLGMSGTGIELDSFISKCYESLDDSITMYFFNETKEITGSKDKQALLDKLHIVLLVGGTVLWVLKLRGILILPDALSGLHPVVTGIAVGAILTVKYKIDELDYYSMWCNVFWKMRGA